MCRSIPHITNGNIVKKYVYGAPVTITCTANGDEYAGYTLWDKTSDGCFLHDALIKTVTENPVAPS
ncbi:hypothetical protein NY602_05435, partial [Enterobacter hormaechei]|uniref:hypothetical protein n=1 Tax=Enterobacter hormaechei TaxID=158836 RepID=UPI0022F01ED2